MAGNRPCNTVTYLLVYELVEESLTRWLFEVFHGHHMSTSRI